MAANQPIDFENRNGGDQTVAAARGAFVELYGRQHYVIRDVDRMEPFFASVISADDHWLFVSSTGGLTAGRVSPETALFPYVTVDKIHNCATHTGSLSLLRIRTGDRLETWHPFGETQQGKFQRTRNLYKCELGDQLTFEEINHDLQLAFRYTWMTSQEFGFVRHAEVENLSQRPVDIELLDGLQNLLPAGTPRFTQTNSSNLVDAYKWTELDVDNGLALYTLYSGITDRAEPCESLRANVVYALGFDNPQILISTNQLKAFAKGAALQPETLKRGIRGAFLLHETVSLAAGEQRDWQIVANTELSQSKVINLSRALKDRPAIAAAVQASITAGHDKLARIMASGDAMQATAEPEVSVHHLANVVFNVLRGGIFADHYRISAADLRRTIKSFNTAVYVANKDRLQALPETVTTQMIREMVAASGDPQLARLCFEYLPITFGRRHGDPSRPWNQFAIRLRDDQGKPLLSYAGNWRDIFQNWEALALSYPDYTESMIAKFVNASTLDGYNPYRITKEGIDWEVEEPDDPWSYIGYWGDHQIIYLQKLLELSQQFHPQQLGALLHEPVFSYANVPYRIKPFAALLADPKNTVTFDEPAAHEIDQRVAAMGADGKLILDAQGRVVQVNLLEKLLVPLLAKLGNLVVDGGIWMNTQRPEWNDANNALVGHGLSMVTLYYLRRYLAFLDRLLEADDRASEISSEVAVWFKQTAAALQALAPQLTGSPVSAAQRLASLTALGQAASNYRDGVYRAGLSGQRDTLTVTEIRALIADALGAIDQSIATNRRDDGLFHAYNLLDYSDAGIEVDRLYPMLEGQVAALSAGSVDAETATDVLESLFASEVYRPDQKSFMLYPDRALPSFLEKNVVPAEAVAAIPLLSQLVAAGDNRLVVRDPSGTYRFNARFVNATALDDALAEWADELGQETIEEARDAVHELYESVFNHQAFTGRSGTMFGFEGLGCIYWHMVSKLLLATQENFFKALDGGAAESTVARLGALYYRVREGIGFNKTPTEFGAFPTDPYSHTPRHAGARQPGMTGQVKEEILTRFGELGIRVNGGTVEFQPNLLRQQEFLDTPSTFRYLDVHDNWREIELPARSLAFTWCQLPIIYRLGDGNEVEVDLLMQDDSTKRLEQAVLSKTLTGSIAARKGSLQRIIVYVPQSTLLTD